MKHASLARVLLISLAGSACGGAPCPHQAPSEDPNAPLIVGMELVGGLPDDPFRALILLNFVDRDGDLGQGRVVYYAGDDAEPTVSLPLARIFDASGGLDYGAKTGRLQLLVRFRSDTPIGTTLPLVTQIVDAAGRASNCYRLDIGLTRGVDTDR